MVFGFTHFDFPNQKSYSANWYIHVTKEGEEDSMFLLAEVVIPASSAGGIGPLSVDGHNCAGGAEANDALILLLGRTSNISSEDIVDLCCQGIYIADDRDLHHV